MPEKGQKLNEPKVVNKYKAEETFNFVYGEKKYIQLLNKKTINQPTKDPAVVINMKNTKMNENYAGKKYEL